MLSTLPSLIAHRGARDSAPENTVAAIRDAVRQGAVWVEIDVMLTRDGAPVVIHDDALDRTTDGHGPVAAATLAEIRALDAGSWFAPRFAGERVPTLAEALETILALRLGLNLEIKPCLGFAVETAQSVLAELMRFWPADGPGLLLSSFEPECLAAARRLVPACPRGLLMEDVADGWADLAERLDAATLHVSDFRLRAEELEALRATGRPVLVYTVNEPERARALFEHGAAAIFTDRPGAMAKALCL